MEPAPASKSAPSPTVTPARGGLKKALTLALIVLLIIGSGVATVAWVMKDKFLLARQKKQALREAFQIYVAVEEFRRGYIQGGHPMTSNAVQCARPDFVYGTSGTGCSVEILNAGGDYQANNSELLAILMAATHFPDGRPTPNENHALNTEKVRFIQPPLAKDANSPGLGPDGVFRDPWGSPYIVGVDANGNHVTESHFKGIEPPPTLPPSSVTGEIIDRSDYFCAQLRAIAWSLGPDKKADPALKCNEGVNADNIYSWR